MSEMQFCKAHVRAVKAKTGRKPDREPVQRLSRFAGDFADGVCKMLS